MIGADDTDASARLLALAARQPASPAFLSPGRAPLSFGALAEHIFRMRAQLQAWGIVRGDIVAWATGERDETAVALAALPVSSTIAPLNAAATFDALSDHLSRMRPKAVVVPPGASPVRSVARQLGVAELVVDRGARTRTGEFDLVLARSAASLDSDRRVSPDWACLGVTSGSTGRPKLVSHGHRQVILTALATGERLAIDSRDISGNLMPLHLAGGIRNALFQSLLNGGAVNVLPHADVDAFIDAVAANEVTFASASFTILRELMARLSGSARFERGRLRYVRVASGRLESEEMDRLEQLLGVPVVTGLASSETGTTAQQGLPPASRKRGSVGLPVASDIRLVDAHGRDVAQGEVGEIHVRSAQLFDGYFGDAELQAASFVDGWFRMGDLARFDEDGELFLVGRVKEVINRGGDKIAPLEIDAVLAAIPGVADAAAFGVPHPRLGEEVVAVVVPKKGHTIRAEEILRHTHAVLGANRAPRGVHFVDALPRTDGGKLRRHELAALIRDARVVAPDVNDQRSLAGTRGRISDERSSPLEIALAALWKHVLRVADVPPDADFFMLGGDSLRGAALLDQVEAVFGVQLARDALYAHAGTLRAMAQQIDELREGAANVRSPSTIPRRRTAGPLPLSSPQLRAWFLQRLDPCSSAYNEVRAWRVDGALDVSALRSALVAVTVRQPMLRTRFVADAGGEPLQIIDPEPTVDFERVTVDDAYDDEAERVARAIRERAERAFDLAARAPVRWTLLALGPTRHVLIRVWHHIVGDGLSGGVLQRDLSEAYAAARAQGVATLAPLAVDYADYASWQQQSDNASRRAEGIAWWTRHLQDLPILALHMDFRRPLTQSFRGDVIHRRLDGGAMAALEAIGRAQKASPFVTFLAAFSVLLSRLSGDEDVAIGTPVSGRASPELADVIGYFANTLVFRAGLRGAPSTCELIARTREQMRAMLVHADVPFEQLVDALKAPRDPSRNPLFQVAFALRERDAIELRFPDLHVQRLATGVEHAKFDLTLSMIEDAQGIDVRWEYCSDLFERSTVERIAFQYESLIAAMASAPDQPFTTLPLMDGGTLRRMQDAAFGATSAMLPTTIHARFAEQAQRHPHARAIEGLRYRTLDSRANRLARELLVRGVASGSVVAVIRQSAVDVAVAWLAILKAGGAYLPIDSAMPAARVAFMLADARVTHAIADQATCDMLMRMGISVIQPERDAARMTAHPDDAPAVAVDPDSVAYVMHTSGSTGRPKGVAIPHRAVIGLVCGTDCAQLGPDDVVAQLANPAFDASTFEFWGPLLNGARIVPIAKTTAISPRALAATIADERITALFLTTALFNTMASEVPAAFRSCRCVLFGGEAVEPERVAAVMHAGPPRHLIHVYGPTEATTFATWHEVRDVQSKATTIPIGRPLANTEVHVLRAGLQVAAPGEPGEICIGGPRLAHGYVNASEAHAASFVVEAIGGLAPRRLYRTGDIGRRKDDGTIEFLRRRDRQVKIRGHRIELEDVEAAIRRLPEVRDAAVGVRGGTAETRQLVAYLVSAEPSRPPADDVWRKLRAALPDYMLPASVVWLPALPLNASGKLDRASLTAPTVPGARRAGSWVAPRDMFERVLTRIWERVLNVDRLGVYDRFFDHGGDSLMAVRLMNAIERETGLIAPLTVLFVDDTIAGLARALREGAGDHDAPIVAISKDGARAPLVFLHGDFTGGGFYSRALAHALGDDQPVLIVHPHGLTGDAIPATIEAMAADRIRALRTLRPRGPYVLGGHCNGAFVAFEMARQLLKQGEGVPLVLVVEARAPGAAGARPSSTHDGYVTIDPRGGMRVLVPRDRLSDANLRYKRAMDDYAAGDCATHLVIVRSQKLVDPRRDLGWSALASSVEIHEMPGDHVTLITDHADEVARIFRAAIGRATERVPE